MHHLFSRDATPFDHPTEHMTFLKVLKEKLADTDTMFTVQLSLQELRQIDDNIDKYEEGYLDRSILHSVIHGAVENSTGKKYGDKTLDDLRDQDVYKESYTLKLSFLHIKCFVEISDLIQIKFMHAKKDPESLTKHREHYADIGREVVGVYHDLLATKQSSITFGIYEPVSYNPEPLVLQPSRPPSVEFLTRDITVFLQDIIRRSSPQMEYLE